MCIRSGLFWAFWWFAGGEELINEPAFNLIHILNRWESGKECGQGGEFLTIPFAILLSPITVLRHAVSRVLSVRAMLQGKDDKGKGKGKGKDPAQARWETQKARAPFIRILKFKFYPFGFWMMFAQAILQPGNGICLPNGAQTYACPGSSWYSGQRGHSPAIAFELLPGLTTRPGPSIGGSVSQILCLHPRVAVSSFMSCRAFRLHQAARAHAAEVFKARQCLVTTTSCTWTRGSCRKESRWMTLQLGSISNLLLLAEDTLCLEGSTVGDSGNHHIPAVPHVLAGRQIRGLCDAGLHGRPCLPLGLHKFPSEFEQCQFELAQVSAASTTLRPDGHCRSFTTTLQLHVGSSRNADSMGIP